MLGFVCFTLFGLVYGSLPSWGRPRPNAARMAIWHLWLGVIGVLGVYLNGIFGYLLLDKLAPGFDYSPPDSSWWFSFKPTMSPLQLWLTIDGGFLALYGVGCALFLAVLFTTQRLPAPPEE